MVMCYLRMILITTNQGEFQEKMWRNSCTTEETWPHVQKGKPTWLLEFQWDEQGDLMQRSGLRYQHTDRMRKTYTKNVFQSRVFRPKWGKMDLLQRGDSGKWFWTWIENNILGKFQYSFSFPGLKLYPTKVYSHCHCTVFQSWWHYFLVGKSPTWYYSGFYFLLLILACIYFTLYNYFHFTNIYLVQSSALSRNVYSVKSYSHPYIHSIFISLNPNSLVYTKKKVDF